MCKCCLYVRLVCLFGLKDFRQAEWLQNFATTWRPGLWLRMPKGFSELEVDVHRA